VITCLKPRLEKIFESTLAKLGPNRISSLHIIGEIFDKIYPEGSLGGIIRRNVQITLVPSAGATIVELKLDVPGTYTLVVHSIFRVA
jgi:nitrite reductase (NO-forming)